jgi:hypothetical protein
MKNQLLGILLDYLEYADLYPENCLIAFIEGSEIIAISATDTENTRQSYPITYFLRKNKEKGCYEPNLEAVDSIALPF